MMYIGGKPIAICAIEELLELPQITVCIDGTVRNDCIVSVYTKPEFRGKGYQQELITYLLDFAKAERFNDITLTTNTPDEKHIYSEVEFKMISNKIFLAL